MGSGLVHVAPSVVGERATRIVSLRYHVKGNLLRYSMKDLLDSSGSIAYHHGMETPLQKAIRMSGGAAVLARHLGITSQAISQWRKAPASRAMAIQAATGGEVTVHALRPDIFGKPTKAA